MATKAKKQMRQHRRRDQRKQSTELSFRSFGVRASSVDDEQRSVEAYLTTETPVPEYDYNRMEIVPRVLLTTGAMIPQSRQIPLLDNHSRFSTSDQLGSIRDVRVEADGVVGRLVFSSTASDEWTKVREGHITDVSAGFRVMAETYVKSGETRSIQGREFTGPVNVATKWRLHEGSITPIGADEQAKLRGFDPDSFHDEERFEMNPELKALCIERGMQADLSDEDAQKWMVENRDKLFTPEKKESPTPPASDGGGTGTGGAPGLRVMTEDDVTRLIQERDKKRAQFRNEVNDLCELAGVRAEPEWYDGDDIAEVRKKITDAKKAAQQDIPGARIRFADSQPAERGRAAMGSALTERCLNATGCNQRSIDSVFPESKRDKNADDFRNAGLIDMARTCLEWEGVDTRRLTREQIAIAALGFYDQAGVRASGGAYHTTGSFALLTQDAMNKSMMVGYAEFPRTWLGPMRQAPSVADFKQIHRLRLGAIPNLPVWPDNTEPDAASFADAEEKYAVECRSLTIDFSYRLLVNDDMDALSRVPAMFGTAASRTVNAVAWSQITSNPTMSDGQPLFLESATGNRKQGNLLTTGSAVPNTAGLTPLRKMLRTMRGENTTENAQGVDILNIEPRYLVVPAALEQQAMEITRSSASTEDNKNTGVINQWRTLEPIVEPLLDANSETAFYLFASPSQIDTVEVTFLQGQESPVVRTWMDHKTLSQSSAVLQTFAAKAMNYRGIVKESGQA